MRSRAPRPPRLLFTVVGVAILTEYTVRFTRGEISSSFGGAHIHRSVYSEVTNADLPRQARRECRRVGRARPGRRAVANGHLARPDRNPGHRRFHGGTALLECRRRRTVGPATDRRTPADARGRRRARPGPFPLHAGRRGGATA